jgi:hypothetical protein
MTMKASVFGAVLATWLSGCGAVRNLASGDPEIPFGGVKKTAEYLDSHPIRAGGGGSGAAWIFPLVLGVFCLDAVGDMATLPLAFYLQSRADPPPAHPENAAQTSPVETPTTSNETEASSPALPYPVPAKER